MKGRKRKTKEQHERDGTLNSTRHADLEKVPQAFGTPERPEYLNGHALWMWDFAVPLLVENGTAKAIDAMALTVACEMWGLYRAAMEAAANDPLDRDSRVGVLQYKAAWEASAAKIGLNPTDRQRIRAEAPIQDHDDTSDIIGFKVAS